MRQPSSHTTVHFAWEGQTATLASPDTGQKVEAHGSPAPLFNLAYGDVGRLSAKESTIMSCSVAIAELRCWIR
jgi:hypothetical protein